MKKILLFMLIIPVFFLGGCNFFGSPETQGIQVDYVNYIKVSNANELKNMENTKSYVLDQDIDLDGVEWAPIGSAQNPFRGNFKGDNYTISNFKITENTYGYAGLFGYVEGDIENLNITNFVIDIETDFLLNVGGLVGSSFGSISNVNVDGNIFVQSTMGNIYAGLLAGNVQTKLDQLVVASEFKPKMITENTVLGTIDIRSKEIVYAGGLVGKAHNVKVTQNTVSAGNLIITSKMSQYIGGLIGNYFLYDLETIDKNLSIDKRLILNNIAKTTFTHKESESLSLGGLVGYLQNAKTENNFTIVKIDVDVLNYTIGLIVGENWYSPIKDNLSKLELINISAGSSGKLNSVAGIAYGESQTSDNYYATLLELIFDKEQASQVDVSDLSDTGFYQEKFPTLTETFIEIIKAYFTMHIN